MNIYSFGCSLIFGDELEDTYPSFSQLTWPALWAKSHQFEYSCFAENGISNWAISRHIITEISLKKPDAVIVQWTYPGRLEIRKKDNKFKQFSYWSNVEDAKEMVKLSRASRLRVWPKDKSLEEFEENERKMEEEMLSKAHTFEGMFANLWYNEVSSYSSDLYYSLIWINLAAFWLNHLKIPHVFTSADNEINNTLKTDDALIVALAKSAQSLSPWLGWKNREGNGFMPWAKENNHAFGVSHPLSHSHKIAYEMIKDDLNKILLNIDY